MDKGARLSFADPAFNSSSVVSFRRISTPSTKRTAPRLFKPVRQAWAGSKRFPTLAGFQGADPEVRFSIVPWAEYRLATSSAKPSAQRIPAQQHTWKTGHTRCDVGRKPRRMADTGSYSRIELQALWCHLPAGHPHRPTGLQEGFGSSDVSTPAAEYCGQSYSPAQACGGSFCDRSVFGEIAATSSIPAFGEIRSRIHFSLRSISPFQSPGNSFERSSLIRVR